MSSAAETWFHNAVIDGVQRLYALNLADRPAAEVLPLTAVTWVEVVWCWMLWDERLDAGRLRVAFRDLAASVERWPAPRQLRAHLPARRTEAPALPAPTRGPTAEQRARLDAVYAELRKINGHSHKGAIAPLARGNFPAAHEAATETAREAQGGLELS
jgi:hypothetical protein